MNEQHTTLATKMYGSNEESLERKNRACFTAEDTVAWAAAYPLVCLE